MKDKGAAFFIDTYIVMAMTPKDLELGVKVKGTSGWQALGDTQKIEVIGATVYAQLVVRVASNLSINTGPAAKVA